jgi:steroid delta-isomerase-like uncharacterized protein
MSQERTDVTPRQLVVRFYEEVWNRRDLSVIPAILAPDITFRGSLGLVKNGHAEFVDYVKTVTDALADYRCDIQTMIVEGDHVAARMVFSGRHRAPFLGFRPTGQRVEWAGAAFFTFEHGLVSDLWVLGDLRALYQQLAAPHE